MPAMAYQRHDPDVVSLVPKDWPRAASSHPPVELPQAAMLEIRGATKAKSSRWYCRGPPKRQERTGARRDRCRPRITGPTHRVAARSIPPSPSVAEPPIHISHDDQVAHERSSTRRRVSRNVARLVIAGCSVPEQRLPGGITVIRWVTRLIPGQSRSIACCSPRPQNHHRLQRRARRTHPRRSSRSRLQGVLSPKYAAQPINWSPNRSGRTTTPRHRRPPIRIRKRNCSPSNPPNQLRQLRAAKRCRKRPRHPTRNPMSLRRRREQGRTPIRRWRRLRQKLGRRSHTPRQDRPRLLGGRLLKWSTGWRLCRARTVSGA